MSPNSYEIALSALREVLSREGVTLEELKRVRITVQGRCCERSVAVIADSDGSCTLEFSPPLMIDSGRW